jgi:hypothetical protein
MWMGELWLVVTEGRTCHYRRLARKMFAVWLNPVLPLLIPKYQLRIIDRSDDTWRRSDSPKPTLPPD